MNRLRSLVSSGFLATLSTIAFHAAHAGRPVTLSPRAIALGNAYTAIAQDASAVFWNPAGLPWIGNQEIAALHANLFDSGIKDNHVAFVLPLSPSLAVAADGHHSGFDDGELNFGDTRFDLASGLKLRKNLSLGVNVKYLTRDVRLDEAAVRQGGGAGLDLGILMMPLDRLRIGADLHDVLNTSLHYSDGDGTSLVSERNLRAGAALAVAKSGLIAIDVDDRIHVGAEYSPVEPLDLRAGLEKDLDDTGESPTYGMGVGLRAGIFRFDYALSLHPTLGETSHFGLSLAFNFNPSKIRIEKVVTSDVFASLQKSYAHEPFGSVSLKNLDDRPLAARLSVYAPDLMDQSTEQEILIRPGAVIDVPLTAVFSDRIIERSGDRRVRLSVGVSYLSQRLPRTERRGTHLIAYGPGAVQWEKGVAQAAAFVTQTDPVIMDYAREACRPEAEMGSTAFRSRNIALTASVVDALAGLGVAYLPDPNSPFSVSSQSRGLLDTVHYPRETLAKRAGDCDDTTVLLASLLESVGVPTCLIDVPGHLFLLVGSGIHERNALSLGIDPDLYVVRDNQVWIPIETTLLGRGFSKAWHEGADTYSRWTGRGHLDLVAVREAQMRFEPATLPDPTGVPIAVDAGATSARLAEDATELQSWRDRYMSDRFDAVRENLDVRPEALDEVAHIYFSAGQAAKARTLLDRALADRPSSSRYLNNLANTWAAEGDVARADETYRAALDTDSGDAGIWFNLGLLRYASGDTFAAGEAVVEGLELSGGYEAAARILRLPSDEDVLREGTSRMSEAEARRLLRRAMNRMAQVTVPTDSMRVATRPAPSPRKAWIRVAATRAEMEEMLPIGDLLYWKE